MGWGEGGGGRREGGREEREGGRRRREGGREGGRNEEQRDNQTVAVYLLVSVGDFLSQFLAH